MLVLLLLAAIWGNILQAVALEPKDATDIEVYALGTGGAGIQDADVALWQCSDESCKNVEKLSGCKTLTIGCGFSSVPPGFYKVTVDKGGHDGYSVVELAPGRGIKNVSVIVDEHKASLRPPPRYIRRGGPPPLPVPSVFGEPLSAIPLPPVAPSWLEPVPRTDYYGHSYNITSAYNVTQPDGTPLYVNDIRYNNSIKGIVTADDYYTIKKGDDGYWHYVNFYTGSDSGRAGIDKPVSSDCCGVYEGPPSGRLSLYLPYVPRPGNLDPKAELSGISGLVMDRSGRGVVGANVTVYYTAFNRLTGEHLNLGMVPNPTNPQSTRDDRDSIAGIYAIPYLPPGTYRVVAEKDGHTSSRVVNLGLKNGDSTADITIGGTAQK